LFPFPSLHYTHTHTYTHTHAHTHIQSIQDSQHSEHMETEAAPLYPDVGPKVRECVLYGAMNIECT